MTTMIIKTALGVAAASLMAACAQPVVDGTPLSGEIAAFAWRTPAVGDRYIWSGMDGPFTATVVAFDGDRVSVEEDGGCAYTVAYGSFGPADRWSGCGGSAGRQTGVREGDIHPIAVGSTESWAVSGSNERGDDWSNKRNCEVVAAERVTVPAGAFDTYHVRCVEGSRTREWWLAPALGQAVIFRRSRAGQGVESHNELIAIEPAAADATQASS